MSGSIDLAWTKHIAVLDPSFAVSNFKMRFHLTSDSSVVYPGWYVDDIGIGGLNVPPPTVVYTQDFEPSNGGFTHSGTPDDWQWGTPTITTFPTGCGSGIHCWGTNLAGNYSANSNETLLSPVIDLSGVVLPPGSVLSFTWSQAYHIESATYDHGYAEVSINGGAWQTMWQHTGGTAMVDWADKSFDISTAAGSNVQFRFRLTSNSVVQYEGLYIDNLRISYAAPVVPAVACVPQAGGLVVGNVFDANTLSPLVGADVSNDSGGSTTTVANPNDLGQAPAFYTLFSSSGLHDFTGAINGYGDQVISVDVVAE